MNNSFIISFGDFKIDLPIKTLTSLAIESGVSGVRIFRLR